MIQASSTLGEIDRITTAIKNVFAVDGDLPESEVEKLHVELVQHIDEANARLRHCDDLLRRGLRQEALQECEEGPNLLELVTRLDFPEWDAWADYVIQFGIPPQPPLLLDVAAELNEAYAKAQSLEGLLRMHRLHSLARSPLPVRIAMLRHIATKDPQNPAWRTDIEAYEAARLKQLRTEFSEALAGGHLHAVDALRRELVEAEWHIGPPAALIEEVTSGHRRLVAKAARERLTALEPVINAAFSAFDMPAALAVRAQWDELWPLAALPADDELAMRVRPAFEWLDEEKAQEARRAECQRDVANLEAALDNASTSRHRLMRLYHAVQRHEEPIHPRIQRRYDERLRSLELAERRKHRLMILCGFAAVIGVAAGVGLIIFRNSRASEITATAQALAKFLDEKQPERALEFYESRIAARPYLASAPQIQSLHADVKAQLGDESARRDRLAALLEEAERLAKTATWESVAAAIETTKKAREVARGEGELVRVLTAEQNVTRVEAELQREADERFKKDAAAMLAAAKMDSISSPDELQGLLNDARELVARRHVSSTARQASGIDLLVRKLEDQLKSMAEAQRREESLRAVVNAIGAESAYTRALKGYLIDDSTSLRAADFHEVLAEDLGELARLASWNKLADQWNALSLQSPADAARALELIATAEKEFEYFPGVAEASTRKAYLESVKARQTEDGSTLLGELGNILKDDIFTMKQIKDPRGDGYIYFLAEPRIAGAVVEVLALEDSRDPTKVTKRTFSKKEFDAANPPTERRDTPQKRFAEKANDELRKVDHPYESIVCNILDGLLAEPDMDPILKCRLLQVFYDRAVPGSAILKEELRAFRAGLESKYALEDVNFIATFKDLPPDDPSAADASQAATIRANTEDLLRRLPLPKDGAGGLPSLEAIYVNKVQPRVEKASSMATSLPRLHWRGALFKNSAGEWNIRTGSAASSSPTGKLAVIVRRPDGASTFEVIGVAAGNSLRLHQPAGLHCREGRPVLLLETPS